MLIGFPGSAGIVLIALQNLTLLIHGRGLLYSKSPCINCFVGEGTEARAVSVLLWFAQRIGMAEPGMAPK